MSSCGADVIVKGWYSFLPSDPRASLTHCPDWYSNRGGRLNSMNVTSEKTDNEPADEIMVLITQATSEGSGESVYPRSLARAFAVRTHEVWK